MDVDHGVPVFGRHLGEALVPQNTGIVDHDVHGAKGIQGRLDDVCTAFDGGHIVEVGHRLAAQVLYFLDDLFGR